MREKHSPFIAAVAGAAIVSLAGFALAQSGHGGHHHGSPALSACMAAAPQSIKSNLWSTFKNSSMRSDHEALSTAQQNLAQQILGKNPSLTGYETAVSQAQLKVIQDQDAVAQSVCGQLSASQLAAASTLNTNLQNNRQTMRAYFKAARQTSGE